LTRRKKNALVNSGLAPNKKEISIMVDPDDKTTQSWRSELENKLSKETRDVFIISYFDLSLSFPGGPHPSYFGQQRIDFETLRSWAKQHGWKVKTAPESTHPDQQNTPFIHFTRIDQG